MSCARKCASPRDGTAAVSAASLTTNWRAGRPAVLLWFEAGAALQAIDLPLGGVAGQRRIERLARFLAQNAQMLRLVVGHRLVRIAHTEIARGAGRRVRSGFAALHASHPRILGGAFQLTAVPGMRAGAARPDRAAFRRDPAMIHVAFVDA